MKNFIFSLSKSAKPFIEELWDYFVENYFENEVYYENLGFSTSSLPFILLGIFGGVIAAALLVMYDNRAVGAYVRKMVHEGAVGKDNAVTLYHLGTNMRSSFARATRRSVGLRRVVKCIEEEEYNSEMQKSRAEYEKKREEDSSLSPFSAVEYKFNGEEHYYIPEDKRISAEIKFANRGMKLWGYLLVIIGSAVGFFALMLLLPYILKLLDQMIGSFKSI